MANVFIVVDFTLLEIKYIFYFTGDQLYILEQEVWKHSKEDLLNGILGQLAYQEFV